MMNVHDFFCIPIRWDFNDIIESLKIRNYKVFRNVEIRDIPNLAVFLGKNGTGKITFFDR